jgi:patatin-like phospholipase/acyl hydrolase
MDRPKVILSIDGGGIRGILAGEIVAALETILQQKVIDHKVRISEYVDYFAGTSTGAVLSMLYLSPVNSNQPYFANEAVKLYLENGRRVFKKNRDLHSTDKYSSEAIEELLSYYFGETKFSDLIKPALVTSYNIDKQDTHFFTGYHDSGLQDDYFVKHIARATTAAPGFFPPAKISSLNGQWLTLVDGGVFANNPALCAFTEVLNASSAAGHSKPEDVILISIGTGKGDPLFAPQGDMEMIIARDSATTDHQLKTLFNVNSNGSNYYRFNPVMGEANNALDDTSPENIQRLYEAAQHSVAYYYTRLNQLADTLIGLKKNIVL